MAELIGGNSYDYDELPYPAQYFPETHPDRLAVISTLFGLHPAPVTVCRVLELGCGIGSNLNGIAYSLPESQFVGVDLSARQIAVAKTEQDALGLTNITFHALDLQAIDGDFGMFDYIIAHGVYSWVAPEVRDSLLRVCAQNLAPNGIVYISYNVYPGWHLKQAVREMAQFHTQHLTKTGQIAHAAEALLSTLAYVSAQRDDESSNAEIAATILEEARQRYRSLIADDPALLLHDDLNAINHPVYFYQFVEHARHHALSFLSEADFCLITHSDFPLQALDAVAQRVAARADFDDSILFEQYMDFARLRLFRKSLLRHTLPHSETPLLDAQNLGILYVAAGGNKPLVSQDEVTGALQIEAGDAPPFPLKNQISQAAIIHLFEIAPRVVPVAALFEAAFAQLCAINPACATHREEHWQLLCSDLLQIAGRDMGMIALHAHIPRRIAVPGEFPRASQVARSVIKHWESVPNFLNELYRVSKPAAALLPWLDGNYSRSQLMTALEFQDPAELAMILAELAQIGVLEA